MSPVYKPPTLAQRLTSNITANRIVIYTLLAMGIIYSGYRFLKESKADSGKKKKWSVLAAILLSVLAIIILYVKKSDDKRDKAIGFSKLSPEELLQQSLNNAVVPDSPLLGKIDEYTVINPKTVSNGSKTVTLNKGEKFTGKVVEVRISTESRYANPPQTESIIEFTYQGMTYKTTIKDLASKTQELLMTI